MVVIRCTEGCTEKQYCLLSNTVSDDIRKECFSPGAAWPGFLCANRLFGIKRLRLLLNYWTEMQCEEEEGQGGSCNSWHSLTEGNNALQKSKKKKKKSLSNIPCISGHDLVKHPKSRKNENLVFFFFLFCFVIVLCHGKKWTALKKICMFF